MGRKNTGLMYAVLILASVACLVVAAFGYLRTNRVITEGSNSITALQNFIIENTRSGYVAITHIDAGEMITEAMVQFSGTIPSDVDSAHFMTIEDIGKVATVDVEPGMPIMQNMISAKLASDYKERECSFIWLNTNLKDNDFVDVRIMFENGEDYIIAAKKSIKNVDVSINNVFLWLTEEEIQLLDAAIVDANLHNAKIYVTRYIKPEVQEASEPTYQPNSSVMKVMELNPNIVAESARKLSVSARAAMEKRLQLFEQAYPTYDFSTEVGSMGGNYDNSTEEANAASNATSGSSATENSTNTTQEGTNSSNTSEEVEYVD